MIKSLIIMIGLVLFSGCTTKSALSVFGQDSIYEKGLEYTQVDDIINSLETKAILNATYLNAIDEKYNDEFHNFLVGIYIVNDNEKDEDKFLNNKKYILTLNNQQINKSKQLVSTHTLWEHIPMKNPHAKYYIVSFKKDASTTLNLQYKHKIFGLLSLSFVAE
jgi:hypothetical protein